MPEPFNERTWAEFLNSESGRWLSSILGYVPTTAEAPKSVDKEIIAKRKPKDTMNAFER